MVLFIAIIAFCSVLIVTLILLYLVKYNLASLTVSSSAFHEAWSGNCRLRCVDHDSEEDQPKYSSLLNRDDSTSFLLASTKQETNNECMCESCPCQFIHFIYRMFDLSGYNAAIAIFSLHYSNVIEEMINISDTIQDYTRLFQPDPKELRAQFVQNSMYDSSTNFFFEGEGPPIKQKSFSKLRRTISKLVLGRPPLIGNKTKRNDDEAQQTIKIENSNTQVEPNRTNVDKQKGMFDKLKTKNREEIIKRNQSVDKIDGNERVSQFITEEPASSSKDVGCSKCRAEGVACKPNCPNSNKTSK